MSKTAAAKLDFITTPRLAAMPGIAHGFFTRRGGASTGLYAGTNCGRGSHDDPKLVAENRRRVAAAIGVATEEQLLTLYQCHSAKAVNVAAPWADGQQPEADAIVTGEAGLALGILTADCVPVLFADSQARIIGAAHAGWKGAFGGVLEATLAAMVAKGAGIGRVLAAIGPSIRQPSYEVSADFRLARIKDDPAAAPFFIPGKRPDHAQFDLPSYVKNRLQRAGIAEIEDCGLDTCIDSERFFSYRRTTLAKEPDYGRQISVITIR